MAKFSDKKDRFCREWLANGGNGTDAYLAAYPNAKSWKRTSVGVEASKLLKQPDVRARIDELRKPLQDELQRNAADLLCLWWEAATADPRELIEFHRVACRYCHGEGHEYQWSDAVEYAQAVHKASKTQAPLPLDAGGYGYTLALRPVQDCPQCLGAGVERIIIHDTRDLSRGAALLYNGIRRRKEGGIELAMQDRGAYMDRIAKHLGMFIERKEISGPNGEAMKWDGTVKIEFVDAEPPANSGEGPE